MRWEFDSVEAAISWQEASFGAMVAAQRLLGDRYREVRERMLGIVADCNRGRDGRIVLPAAYLLAVARKPA